MFTRSMCRHHVVVVHKCMYTAAKGVLQALELYRHTSHVPTQPGKSVIWAAGYGICVI
jgi:hypothetical protein